MTVSKHPRPAVRIDGIPYYIDPPPCVDNMAHPLPYHTDTYSHSWQEQWRSDVEIRSVCVRCGMRKQEIPDGSEPTLYALHPNHTERWYTP